MTDKPEIEVVLTEADIRELLKRVAQAERNAHLQAVMIDHLVMGLAAHLPENARADIGDRCQRIFKEVRLISPSSTNWLLWHLLPTKGVQIREDCNYAFGTGERNQWIIERAKTQDAEQPEAPTTVKRTVALYHIDGEERVILACPGKMTACDDPRSVRALSEPLEIEFTLLPGEEV